MASSPSSMSIRSGPNDAVAVEGVDERIEFSGPRERQARSRRHGRVHIGHGRERLAGPGNAAKLAGDDADERCAVVAGDEPHVPRFEALVARLEHLVLGWEVHPELNAVECPTLLDEHLGRLLDVKDAGAGGHPLRRAIRDEPAATCRVLVLEGAVHHVGDCFEAAVRMPRRAFRFARRVFHRPDVVEEEEGVGEAEVHAREGAPHFEAFTLQRSHGGNDREQGPPAR